MQDKIPKIIHYCWFGKNPKTELVKKCIKSWKRYLPDYEIKEWNDNDLVNCTNQYVQEAYKVKKYAFVSDYFRLYALYNYGGIYLDTDVEITSSMDKFLENSFFICHENYKGIIHINTGLIGAFKKNDIIKNLLNEYENISFIKSDGGYDLTTNPVRILNYLQKCYEVPITNGETNIVLDDCGIIYPYWYFCKPEEGKENYAIHHYAGSWLDKRQNSVLENIFSIKNSKDKKYKIITILGIKIKIRKK